MARCTDDSITDRQDCTGSFNVTGELCSYLPTEAADVACRLSSVGAPFPRQWQTFPTQTLYAGESFDNIGGVAVSRLYCAKSTHGPVRFVL